MTGLFVVPFTSLVLVVVLVVWWHGYSTGWRRMFNITMEDLNAKHPEKEPLPLYSIPRIASWLEKLGRRVFVGRRKA